jgi:hypothetical protein
MTTYIVELAEGPQGPPGPQGLSGGDELPYSKRVDFVDNFIYIGEAEPGSSETDPIWRIKRTEIINDEDMITVWADGDGLFNNIWSMRLSATYL